jgi:predicted short-subunit dehydrogenase-like oxidoreductase (DUF2520 family)
MSTKPNEVSAIVVGAGHVSFHFCHAMHHAGFKIKAVYSRNVAHAQEITQVTGGLAVDTFERLPKEADFCLVSIPDGAIGEVAEKLSLHLSTRILIVHTSGQTSIDVLKRSFTRAGILYPLQSLHKDYPLSMEHVPLIVTVGQDEDRSELLTLSSRISGQVFAMNDEDRMKLHIPAVLVNNFVNYLYAEAWRLCRERDLPFDLFLPLIRHTAERLSENTDPLSLQTGPAVRGDESTLVAHAEQLKKHPELLTAYQVLTRNIQKLSQ